MEFPISTEIISVSYKRFEMGNFMNLDTLNNINKQAGQAAGISLKPDINAPIMPDAGKASLQNVGNEFAIAHSALADSGAYSKGALYDNEEQASDVAENNSTTQDTCDSANEDAAKARERMTKEDEELLDEVGMSLEKYTAKVLDRVLDSIKEVRQSIELSIEGQIESMQHVARQFEEMGCVKEEDVTALLRASDIPVTQANISMMMKAIQMSSVIPDISDDAKAYMVKNDADLSIEQFYKANFSTKDLSGRSQSFFDGGIGQGQFDQLKDDIQKVVESVGADSSAFSDRAYDEAKWIVDKGLALNAQTLTKLDNINEISNDATMADMVAHVTDVMRDGANPVKTDLTTVMAGMSFTTLQLVKQRADAGEGSDFAQVAKGLEEIRMQMIESLYYEDSVYESGAYETNAGLSVAKESMQVVWRYSDISSINLEGADKVVAGTFGQKTVLSNFADALNRYEESGTQVRADLGDRISKAFAGIESLLKTEGIEVSEANIRATRLLGYAGMEVNETNITSMKQYHTLVESTFDALKPAVVVRMVKQGINPLNMEFEELRKTADEISQELGYSKEEKYSEFLYRLDKNNELTKEERSAYIGIYRLINAVKNTDNAAIAVTAKANRELTMSNLLTAVRTLRGGRLDETVSDEFGAIDVVNVKGTRIDEQIVAAAKDVNTSEVSASYVYENMLVDGTLKKLDSGGIVRAGTENIINLLGETLEDIVFEDSASDDNVKTATYKEIIDGAPVINVPQLTGEAVDLLEGNFLPLTLENISMAADYFEGKITLGNDGKQKQSSGVQILNALKSKGGLERADSVYRQQVEYMKNEASDFIMNCDDSEDAKLMLNRIKAGTFLNRLADNRMYSFPVEDDNGEMMNVNMMFRSAGSDSSVENEGRVDVSVNTQTLGRVKVSATIFVQEISVTVLSDMAKSVDKLKDSDYELRSAVESVIGDLETNSADIKLTINYARMQIDEAFGMTSMASGARIGSGASSKSDYDSNRTDTDKLCRVAGTLVDYLRKVCA